MGTDNHDSWEKKPRDFKQEDTISHPVGWQNLKILTLAKMQSPRYSDILSKGE